jgi:hypothetical protein
VVTILTTNLTSNNSSFCPHTIFICFVWISEQTAIISLYSINWLDSITETECLLRGTDWVFIYNSAGQFEIQTSLLEKDSLLLIPVQTGSAAHHASFTINPDSLSRGKAAGAWHWSATPSTTKVKNEWSYTNVTGISPLALLGLYRINGRLPLNFTFFQKSLLKPPSVCPIQKHIFQKQYFSYFHILLKSPFFRVSQNTAHSGDTAVKPTHRPPLPLRYECLLEA